jgi:hypothetical protein
MLSLSSLFGPGGVALSSLLSVVCSLVVGVWLVLLCLSGIVVSFFFLASFGVVGGLLGLGGGWGILISCVLEGCIVFVFVSGVILGVKDVEKHFLWGFVIFGGVGRYVVVRGVVVWSVEGVVVFSCVVSISLFLFFAFFCFFFFIPFFPPLSFVMMVRAG